MSDDEVFRLWAGDVAGGRPVLGSRKVLTFARAVRAAALREAAEVCAVVAAEAKRMDGLDGDYESGVEAGAEQCCDALRARAEGRT